MHDLADRIIGEVGNLSAIGIGLQVFEGKAMSVGISLFAKLDYGTFCFFICPFSLRIVGVDGVSELDRCASGEVEATIF